jgi:hypothetical protein
MAEVCDFYAPIWGMSTMYCVFQRGWNLRGTLSETRYRGKPAFQAHPATTPRGKRPGAARSGAGGEAVPLIGFPIQGGNPGSPPGTPGPDAVDKTLPWR